MALTRRRLINLVGRAGGASAAYSTMVAMGLLPVPTSYAGPPVLAPHSGEGSRIIIVGAGIAGMVAAYELGRAGYDCIILEARQRSGGRNWTLRGGDKVEEIDSTQDVAWDTGEHLYFNAGPARLPYHHQAILSYCRELGVPLEVMSNDNRGGLLHDEDAFGGKPQLARRVINDMRGLTAELAAKAVDKEALELPVGNEDKERLVAMLRAFGALDRDLRYRGSARAGMIETPGAGDEPGKTGPPLSLTELLRSDFWHAKTQFGEGFAQAATMMQPVGGMDRIAQAFARELKGKIVFGAQVVQMRRTSTGARVVWRDRVSGQENATEAPYIIVTLPLPVLARLDSDFSQPFTAAIAAAEYVPAAKVAFQAERRFWEEDHQIYGGISWTNREITQIWYPSAGLHARKGIIVGAYIWSEALGRAFGDQTPAERIQTALASGEKIHPGYAKDLGPGVGVAWGKVPFSEGGWAEWSAEARRGAYLTLLKGDGPYHLAGEHLSYVTGWQEGAVLSAHHAIKAIADRVRAKKSG